MHRAGRPFTPSGRDCSRTHRRAGGSCTDFRDAGATDIQAGACTLVAHDTPTMKRLYRLSAEATGSTAEAKGILSSTEAGEMIADLIRLEEDPSSVVVKFPDIWVIATR